MSDSLDQVGNLSPNKRALYELLLRRKKSEQSARARITPRQQPAGDSFPLSFAQQRLWFINQLEPGSPSYNLPTAVRLAGSLNVSALERALREIVRRHEVLRTTFTVDADSAFQVIGPAGDLSLPCTDLTHLGEAERAAEVTRLAAEDAATSFDLERGPLLRAGLLKLAEDEHVLLLTMHHIVSDGWSMAVLVKEVGALYEAYDQGRESPLPELPVQYADYAVWQRELLTGEVLDEQLAYWRERLTGAPPVFEFPTDRPRPAQPSQRGARVTRTLDPELAAGVRALARREGATLFMTLLAGFKAVLAYHAGAGDVVVGTDVANRSRGETEGLIGFFVNQLVLRTDVSGDPTFAELVGRVREVCLGAYAHQEVPFERVVEELNPERSLGHTPLFQIKFLLQQNPAARAASDADALAITRLEIDNESAKFDMVVNFMETGDELVGLVEYATDLFDEATVRRLLGHFERLLAGAVADPGRRLSRLDCLGEDERRLMLREWNDTAGAYRDGLCIHDLFEAQAALTPDAPALIFEDRQLSYAELNAQANRVAHYLQLMGVRPGVLVAFCLGRTPDLIAGMLGILKAGGAYLPLDPAYPKERIAQMLEDARPSLLLTAGELEDLLPEHGALVVCLDDDLLAAQADENPALAPTPADLAYVIYTSGSTGKPKGVMIPHGALVSRIEDQVARFDLRPGDRMMHTLSFSFDAAVEYVFPVLASGGGVILNQLLSTVSPPELLADCERHGATGLVLPPSYWQQLIEELKTGGRRLPATLRRCYTGGESLSVEKLAELSGLAPDGAVFINNYGPAEAAVSCTSFSLPMVADAARGLAKLPIGRPMTNTSLYVLDAYMRPAPVGVGAELCIGGVGLAWGYLNSPAQTAEKFVPDSFGDEPGARLYRSGDRARYLPDGNLDLLGRVDNQVKIRAYRIELGEIETMLGQHPAIRQCAVVVREDEPGDKRLIAYVVAGPGADAGAADLRGFLRERLPEYMMPAAFVTLDALPLLPSGKVNRRALPRPELDRADSEQRYAAPETPAEETLAAVWAQVLGLERVGIDDNFFFIGGDSIRSIQVLSRAAQQGITLTLQQLFQHQTIRELARACGEATAPAAAAAGTQPFALVSEADRGRMPAGVVDAYPLTMAQTGMVFHSEYRADIYHSIASQHLRLGVVDLEALREALRQVVARHPVLRTSFALAGYAESMQLVHESVEVPLGVDDIRNLAADEQEAEIARWIETESGRHFNWQSAPLMRCHVHLRAADEIQFTLSAPHALLDGWSDGLLFVELLQTYLALARGEGGDAALRPSPRSAFRDYVALEREALASADSRRYWAEKLAGAEVLQLPRYDAAQRGDEIDRTATFTVATTPAVFAGLNDLARLANVPLKSVLLAAHLKVLSFAGGAADVLTGMVLNGRPEEEEGERTLGLFLNTLPFRLGVGRGSWVELARDTFAAEAELIPHRRYPLAQIQADLGGRALFETYFDFTHFHVYESVKSVKGIEVLGRGGNTVTNYTVAAFFNLNVASSQVTLSLSVNLNQLSDEQAEALRAYYERTLAAMAGAPHDQHEAVSLLTEDERRRQLVEWNQTRSEYPADKCVHDLFAEQAARTPDAVAVVCGDARLTYGELDARSSRLAGALRRRGVGPDSLVGVLVSRSAELVVALLGILKAGGAYVPLDVEYPAERLAYMVEDSGAALVLTDGTAAAAELTGAMRGRAVDVAALLAEAEDEDEAAAASRAAAGARANGQNLAYVIYTSGSTGRPKGVMISHGALANHMRWMQGAFPLDRSDAVLQKTSISFDASVWEFYAPLLAGARLVVADAKDYRVPAYLVRLIAAHGVSVLQVVPTLLRMLVAEPGFAKCGSLRRVFCGGEALTADLVNRFAQTMNCELHNLYGPTEATIDATTWDCTAAEVRGTVPVGRPVANTRAYILDARLRPLPTGVAGELHIGGGGLARGYLNRPALTAERFVPDPFSAEPGARLYRTGDSARYLPGGDIEYLGRADEQVKLRGFRIELGEIESELRADPSVGECAVVLGVDAAGEQRLVAYVVASGAGTTAGPAELRERLRGRLPEYMLPAVFVTLDRLPLTPNGKLDRKALPAPAGEVAEADGYAAPRNEVEELLGGIWAEVLGVERVGVTDNFFELGGHSLQVIRVISHVRETFQIELHLRSMFETPTLEGLAAQVQQALQEERQLAALPIVPVSRKEALPLSFAQQRLWFVDQLEAGSFAYNIPSALRLSGRLDLGALERTMNEIVRRHEVLRTSLPTVEGRPVQVIAPAGQPVSLPVEDLRALPESEREAELQRRADEEVRRPFDLAAGPLLRIKVLRLDEEDHAVLFTMHHVISDGWSTAILVREIAALYRAFAEGSPSPLPEPQLHYADYAHWQRQWLQGEVLERLIGYWKRQLGGPLPVLALPTDRPRETAGRAAPEGRRETVVLPDDLTRELKALSRREGVTLFMTLLAGFQTLLYRSTGQTDVIVGTASANRNRRGLEGLIGFFVNMLALRTDLSGRPSFKELLRRVREVALGAYAHQDLPFEKIVEELKVAREVGHTPIFQVAFGLQNAATRMEPVRLPGLTLSPIGHELEAARYDLTIWMNDGAKHLSGTWTYNAQVFDAERIARMQRHYETLLRSIVERPDAPLDELDMLTADEQEQLAREEQGRQEQSYQGFLRGKPQAIRVRRDDA